MTHSKSCFTNFRSIKPIKVHLADDGTVEAIGCGDVEMSMKTPHGLRKGVLTNVWFVPKLSRNLFSVARFARDVGPITFDSTKCVATMNGSKWTIGKRIGKGLFQLDMTPTVASKSAATANALVSSDTSSMSKSYLWHLRLGHIGHGGLDMIVKNKLGVGIDIGSASKWEF